MIIKCLNCKKQFEQVHNERTCCDMWKSKQSQPKRSCDICKINFSSAKKAHTHKQEVHSI